jgi:hypothetical protein
METDFNTIKTIKLINRETLLKNVYNSSNEVFNLQKLSTQAVKETLSNDVIGSLKAIFEDLICHRDDYLEIYKEIPVKEKTPRRYGKTQILKDIKEQGGVATGNQQYMLALNEVKSAYINLQGKGTSDRYCGTTKISESEGRAIQAAVLTFMKKVKPMLNRRR